jgi:hypothetical protein
MAIGTAVFRPCPGERLIGAPSCADVHLSLRMILFLTIQPASGSWCSVNQVIGCSSSTDLQRRSDAGTVFALVFFHWAGGSATVEIVDRVFYALHDTRSPVLVAVGAIALTSS